MSQLDRLSVNPARIQFTWGASASAPAKWKLGTFCFFRRAKSPVTGTYYVPRTHSAVYPLAVLINLRALLIGMFAAGCVVWFGGAAALAGWYGKKPYNLITYSDLAFPWRWSRIEELRGRGNLAQAEAFEKSGDMGSAFAFLRSGLARYPEDTSARLHLASLYILLRVRTEAEKTLLSAFDYAYPGEKYIRRAIELLEQGDNPQFLVDFCDRAAAALAAGGEPDPDDGWYIDATKMKALIELERTDEAVAFVEKKRPSDVAMIRMAKVSRALSRGDWVDAREQVSHWLTAMPDSESAMAAAVRVDRLAGQLVDMDAMILRLRSRYPDNPKHVGLGLSENLLAGQKQAALDLLDISVIRFANTPEVYAEWAEVIGQTGQIEVLARFEQLVREMNGDPYPVMLARLMAAIRISNWDQAAECSARFEREAALMPPQLRAVHAIAKALLETCTESAKGTQNTLAASISDGNVTHHLYRQIVDALAASKRYAAALEVLVLAEGYYPASRYIAAQRAAISSKLAEQEAALARTAAENAPVAEVAPTFEDATAFLAVFDSQVRDGRTAEAQRLVRAVRKDSPSWLKAALPEVEWREILLAAQLGDLALLQLNLRTYLRTRPQARADAVTAQAIVWNTQDRRSAAVSALREVIKAQPEHKEALRLLVEWVPREAGGVADAEASGRTKAAVAIPASAKELFALLDSQAGDQHSVESLGLIRAVRRADPDWLAAALADLEWREILLAAGSDDLSLLQLKVRTYMRARPAEVERCLGQAREWYGQQKRPAAKVVVREALLQYPDQASAKALFDAWGEQ